MRDEGLGTDRAIELSEIMDPENLILTTQGWAHRKFRGLMFALAHAGFGLARVTCGLRTFEQQVVLYGHGRSADEMAAIGLSAKYARPKDRRVTWLAPHSSRHVKGRAVDVDFSAYPEALLSPVSDLCRELGITWGGDWSVRDYAHFEV
jgi:peptidoglycan L-alanyl-D-glutamate endopeptidase CwlK